MPYRVGRSSYLFYLPIRDPKFAFIGYRNSILIFVNLESVQLISTGAFEIALNDMPLWSKLESGRIPQPGELFQVNLFRVIRFSINGFIIYFFKFCVPLLCKDAFL